MHSIHLNQPQSINQPETAETKPCSTMPARASSLKKEALNQFSLALPTHTHAYKKRPLSNLEYAVDHLPITPKPLTLRSVHSLSGASKAPSVPEQVLFQLIEHWKSTKPDQEVPLGQLLKEKGYSPIIRDVKLIQSDLFKQCNLNQLTFKHCTFTDCSFNQSNIKQVHFQSCQFKQCPFTQALLEHSIFSNSQFDQAYFINANLNETHFDHSTLVNSSFENAQLNQCQWFSSSMSNTHFLDANIVDSEFCQRGKPNQPLTKAELKAFSASKVQPTLCLLSDPHQPGVTTPKAAIKLENVAKLNPMRISTRPFHFFQEAATQDSDKSYQQRLSTEVTTLLKKLANDSTDKDSPLPQRLIHAIKAAPKDYKLCHSILMKAKTISEQVDAIYLPGGEDVPPALYGQAEHKKTKWEGNYYRSLLELGLIHYAHQKGIPLMAVCRGFQITQVYFGAKLIQDIPGHKGMQTFNLSDPTFGSQYQNAFKEGRTLTSAVLHHQGVPTHQVNPSTFHVAVQFGHLAKSVEPKNGGAAPQILLQFHPEFYNTGLQSTLPDAIKNDIKPEDMTDNNDQFWKIFAEAAQTLKHKRKLNAALTSGNFMPLKPTQINPRATI